MAWFSRVSRWGDIHLVYGQEWDNSCGLASALMCVFKINKLVPGATSFAKETAVRDRYSELVGGGYNPETTGTFPQHLCTILREHTGGNWINSVPSAGGVPAKLIDVVGLTSALLLGPTVSSNPVIIGVNWENGGAHWIVIDSIRAIGNNYWATICDPWDTNLHIQRFAVGSPFKYVAEDVVQGVNFWGTNKMKDDKAAGKGDYTGTGTVSNWGIIHRA